METTYSVKCLMIGRKPRVDDNQFKTLSFGFYDVNDPHKEGAFPTKSVDIPNIEQLSIEGLNVSYYLEGNDILINNLQSVIITVDGSTVVLRGESA